MRDDADQSVVDASQGNLIANPHELSDKGSAVFMTPSATPRMNDSMIDSAGLPLTQTHLASNVDGRNLEPSSLQKTSLFSRLQSQPVVVSTKETSGSTGDGVEPTAARYLCSAMCILLRFPPGRLP